MYLHNFYNILCWFFWTFWEDLFNETNTVLTRVSNRTCLAGQGTDTLWLSWDKGDNGTSSKHCHRTSCRTNHLLFHPLMLFLKTAVMCKIESHFVLRDVQGQRSLYQDFCCYSCPGTKGQRDKETFSNHPLETLVLSQWALELKYLCSFFFDVCKSWKTAKIETKKKF